MKLLYIFAALFGIFIAGLEHDPLVMCRYTNKARAFVGVDMRVCG